MYVCFINQTSWWLQVYSNKIVVQLFFGKLEKSDVIFLQLNEIYDVYYATLPMMSIGQCIILAIKSMYVMYLFCLVIL